MKRNFLPDGWRGQARAVLLIAVVVGTILRFFRLGAHELSIDESLSWAESSGHNVKAVLRVQHQLDSGKFPIYELAQHGWMRIFGESEAAMRALPALIGSLSIVLVFILGVEVMLAAAARPIGRERPKDRIYMVAAVCALLFAVGLPSVEIARQARMYSMMQAWILAQVIFLLRARRLGGLANYAGLTIFSAIAVATNFTAALVIAAEALWLIYLRLARSAKRRRGAKRDTMDDGSRTRCRDGVAAAFFCRSAIRSRGREARRLRLDQAAGAMGAIGDVRERTWQLGRSRCLRCSRSWAGFGCGASHRDEAVLLILWIGLPPIVLFAGIVPGYSDAGYAIPDILFRSIVYTHCNRY